MKKRPKLYHVATNVNFWLIILFFSFFPLFLTRLGAELYLIPQIEIGIIFFLSIYCRPKAWQIFIYGLLVDTAYGNPLGSGAFTLLMLNYVIQKFRSNLSKQDIKTIFIYFVNISLVITFLRHMIFSLYYGSSNHSNYKEALLNLLVNILFYPILHWLLSSSSYMKNHEN